MQFVVRATITVVFLTLLSGVALAHGGGLSTGPPDRLAIPTWLYLSTGGATIGVSFLLASFITDRSFIEEIHDWHRWISIPRLTLARVARLLGLVGLGFVLITGFVGPEAALSNAAILLVWAGWWAGYTMSIYLVGNSWPALNPFRTLTKPFDEGRLGYPERWNAWPSVVLLLTLIWIEVVSPLADDPRLLATLILLYTLISIGGTWLVGSKRWFSSIDPVSHVFRQYGYVAPLQRTDDGVKIKLPGMGLVENRPADLSEVGFIIALVWGTTYDGLTGTQLWADFARTVVTLGVPAILLYPLVLFLGFGVFFGAYWAASRSSRRTARTLLSTEELARHFASSLVGIAAGYHLAHYLTYFLELSPALMGALVSPFSPSVPRVLITPSWFGGLSIAFVLIGHMLAIWVAHSVSYDIFPSRMQAIRSQYSITAVMVFYTMTSLWIVTQPFVSPPYI